MPVSRKLPANRESEKTRKRERGDNSDNVPAASQSERCKNENLLRAGALVAHLVSLVRSRCFLGVFLVSWSVYYGVLVEWAGKERPVCPVDGDKLAPRGGGKFGGRSRSEKEKKRVTERRWHRKKRKKGKKVKKEGKGVRISST